MTRKIADYFRTQPVVKAWLFGSLARGEERPAPSPSCSLEAGV